MFSIRILETLWLNLFLERLLWAPCCLCQRKSERLLWVGKSRWSIESEWLLWRSYWRSFLQISNFRISFLPDQATSR